jgi:hypothetical protein
MIRKSHIRTTGAACRSGVTKLLGAALVSAAALAPAHADVIDFEGYTGLVGHNEYIEHGVLGRRRPGRPGGRIHRRLGPHQLHRRQLPGE